MCTINYLCNNYNLQYIIINIPTSRVNKYIYTHILNRSKIIFNLPRIFIILFID